MHLEIDLVAAKLLGHHYASHYNAIPYKMEDGHIFVAMEDIDSPTAVQHIADIQDITGKYVVPVIFDPWQIRIAINQSLATDTITHIATQFATQSIVDQALSQRTDLKTPELLAEISHAPAVRLIDSILEVGIMDNISDIHIEPYGDQLRARIRNDGVLYTYSTVDISILPKVISRLKIMAGMDIAESRRPQDGRFTLQNDNTQGKNLEFRISTLPTTGGEKAVIRILHASSKFLSKSQLGFFPQDLEAITALFNKPHGAIFITGPTGSGKSTTLSAFLSELNTQGKNIITIEDPVENPIKGINHISIDRGAGISFPTILRNVLRQDPDIIMVGEVRDEETAKIAVQAACTGHVVLCTIHTNDAPGVIERLADMGIPPYLIAHALSGILSQRLVRKLCPACKQAKETPGDFELKNLPGLGEHNVIYTAVGCSQCKHTGYHGRIAIYDYIAISQDMARELSETPYQLANQLRESNMLGRTALEHVLAGNTTVDEVGGYCKPD